MAYYWKGRSDVLITTRFLLVNKRRWRIHSSGTYVFISTFKLRLPLNLWTPNCDMMWTTPKMHQYRTQEWQQLEFGDTARGQKCATYCFQGNIVWTELYLDMTDQSIYLSRSYLVSGKRSLEPSCLICLAQSSSCFCTGTWLCNISVRGSLGGSWFGTPNFEALWIACSPNVGSGT